MDKSDIQKLAKTVGGIEPQDDKVISCNSCERVIGGASLYGVRNSIMSQDDPFEFDDINEIISHLAKKYDVKREYVRGMKTLHHKLVGKKAPLNHDEAHNNIIFELGKYDPIRVKSKTPPVCNITNEMITDIRKQQESSIDGAVAIEKLLYPHMVSIEKYYGDVAENLYYIINELSKTKVHGGINCDEYGIASNHHGQENISVLEPID